MEELVQPTAILRQVNIGDEVTPPLSVAQLVCSASDGLKALALAEPGREAGAAAAAYRNRVVEALTDALAKVTFAGDHAEARHQQQQQQQDKGHTQSRFDDRLPPGHEKEIERRLMLSSSAVAAAREYLEEVESSPGVAEDDVHDVEAHLKATLDIHEEWNVDDGGGTSRHGSLPQSSRRKTRSSSSGRKTVPTTSATTGAQLPFKSAGGTQSSTRLT